MKRLPFLAILSLVGALLVIPVAHADTVTSSQLDHIVISPNDRPTRVDQHADQQFLAEGMTADNQAITGLTFTWSVGGNIGTITKDGIFTGTKAGTGTVTAVSGTTAATVGVVVKAVKETPVIRATNTAPANTNVNSAQTNVNTAVPTTTQEQSTQTQKTCTTLRAWVWILILFAYVIILLVYFLSLGESRTLWWWIWPAALTAELIALQHIVRCTNRDDWVIYATVLVGALISWFYYRLLRPRGIPPLPPSLHTTSQ